MPTRYAAGCHVDALPPCTGREGAPIWRERGGPKDDNIKLGLDHNGAASAGPACNLPLHGFLHSIAIERASQELGKLCVDAGRLGESAAGHDGKCDDAKRDRSERMNSVAKHWECPGMWTGCWIFRPI